MWVILRPLGSNPWSGVGRYRNCHDVLRSYYTRSGRLYTGLTEADAERLGKLLTKDLSPGSEFWPEWAGIRVGSKDLYFNTDDPMDEMRYLFLKNHKRVASSIFERKSTADYVLIDKEEQAKESNVFNKLKRRASSEFDRLSAEDIRQCLRLYGQNASNMGNEQAENVLYDIIDGNPSKFLEIWVDNKHREIDYLIETAVSKNILRKTKNVYRYGSDIIGHSLEDTVNYLLNPKNQDLKLVIMNEISGKEEFLGNEQSDVKIEPEWGDDQPIEDKPKKSKTKVVK